MINTSIFLTLTFIFVRLSAFFILFNIIFPSGTPKAMKLFIPMILAFIISGSISGVDVNLLNSNYDLMIYFACEVLTGAILGIVTNILFQILKFSGSWIDLHIGFSMLSLTDATAASTTTATGKLLEYFSLVLFFITDSHHLLIKSLIESFSIVSIGSSIISQESMWNCMQIIIEYFFIGVKIALPIVLVIIITDLCMGLVSRVVPQINVMILGMPVKMIVGLLMITLSIGLIGKVFVSALSYLPSIIRKILTVAPVALIFMSDDKTEEATPKKKSDARKKGQIARSKDVGTALTTIATLLVITAFSGKIVDSFKSIIIYYLGNLSNVELSKSTLKVITKNSFTSFTSTILLVVIPIMIAGIIASLMQSGFLFTAEGLKPSFGKLNPLNGFKNMFSKKSAFDLLKNLVVVSIVTFIGYSYMKDNYRNILQISSLYEGSIGVEIKNIVVGLFTKIVVLLVILAATDYFVQFRFHKKELMMSKQEIKDEYKQAEGDQQVKGRIKQKQREMSRQRMMSAVGDATVVITNPTHIAVAIKYEESGNNAPKLVAKGADYLAIKIKEKATENNVPIIENKPLARMIYKEVELEREIPHEMYQAVAEILVAIYKMKDKKKN
ncbi:MAG: fused FliR family export protein/FlhB family type III secretion system protein [Clostridium sp.]|nr:fused FliR family export protein/FlhB family type III secretion system protein [Clostridium sp.]